MDFAVIFCTFLERYCAPWDENINVVLIICIDLTY